MLTGPTVLLRAREVSDVAVLQELLYEDVPTRVRADNRPWRPMARDAVGSPYAVTEAADDVATFSVVETGTGLLAGEALLWAIDAHNRCAHVGMALLLQFRRRGLSHEVLDILSDYAFAKLDLHRLQIETLVDNRAMIATATRAGFLREGTRRGAVWVDGTFCDEAVFGRVNGERFPAGNLP